MGPLYGKEDILYADVDLKKIINGKRWNDVVGHYARADVVQLLLNESPQPPVVHGSHGPVLFQPPVQGITKSPGKAKGRAKSKRTSN